MINEIMPIGSILTTDSNGLFEFYLDYRNHEDGISFLTQRDLEGFKEFTERLNDALNILLLLSKTDKQKKISPSGTNTRPRSGYDDKDPYITIIKD